MSSKTKTEKQSSIREFTDWDLRDNIEKLYDDMGLDEFGNTITADEKESLRRKKMAKEFQEMMEEMELRRKKQNRWGPLNDRKL